VEPGPYQIARMTETLKFVGIRDRHVSRVSLDR
jgi:hypothetical protein